MPERLNAFPLTGKWLRYFASLLLVMAGLGIFVAAPGWDLGPNSWDWITALSALLCAFGWSLFRTTRRGTRSLSKR
jgi:hypothetical protein